MRKILIPVAAAAVAFSSAAFAQTGGASGTSGGAAAKSGSDATAPASMTAKDGMAKREREENNEEKEGVIDMVTARAMCWQQGVPDSAPASAGAFRICRYRNGLTDGRQPGLERIPDQCFDRSPIAPVAISASHDALPRSGA
jgi:hypothetical protein